MELDLMKQLLSHLTNILFMMQGIITIIATDDDGGDNCDGVCGVGCGRGDDDDDYSDIESDSDYNDDADDDDADDDDDNILCRDSCYIAHFKTH